jgi:hypothetical protein
VVESINILGGKILLEKYNGLLGINKMYFQMFICGIVALPVKIPACIKFMRKFPMTMLMCKQIFLASNV